jgi:hypothetical protein
VQLAILKQAGDNFEQIGHYLALAVTDWRDLLVGAGLGDEDWRDVQWFDQGCRFAGSCGARRARLNLNTLLALLPVCLAIPAGLCAQERAAPDTTRSRGIAYSVSMNRLSLAVQSANGRGRIDITEKARGPIVLIDSIDFTPLGEPGDYYLFDNTTLFLVQPRSHTFIAFAPRDGTYNFDNDRAGWPTEFEIPMQIRVDTVRPGALPTSPSRPDGPIQVFWHLDVDWGLPTFQVVSRGRLSALAAPAGEATVIRWVEPTLALDSLAVRDSTWFPNERLGLTSVTPLAARARARTTNFSNRNRISGLRVTEIDRSRFALPGDVTETRRGSETPPMQPERLARWRGWP